MSTVLVTGGAGFIGYHLTASLLKDGYKVIVVDDLSTGTSDHISKELNFVQIDLSDKRLGEVFAYNEIAYVFHLAGQTNVPFSVSFPAKDAKINILGLINLLDKCQNFPVKKLIYLSGGAAIYGDTGDQAATESSPTLPVSPLGLSKAVGEQYLALARRMWGLNYTILRGANIYGPNQDPFRDVGVVASFCQFLLNNQPPTIYGNGNQTRDFLYVDDVVAALKQTLIEGDGETINIGSGQATMIIEIFNKIKELTGFTGDPYYRPVQAGNLQHFAMDVTKARAVLKWQAKTSLAEGLAKTVEYYRQKETA